jgi:alpha-L-fucosidase
MKRTLTALGAGLLILVELAGCASKPNIANETKDQRDQRMAWWREARFGMFIHWGLYAVPAGEWKGQKTKGAGEWIMHDMKISVQEYETLVGQFNPRNFDARRWVQIAKDAGMKYIVITSKHHDGFSLFDSKVSDYDVMATPFHRDTMKELSQAARKEGIQICWYHSILDWHHPDAHGDRFALYRENYLKPQLKELLSNYGRIGVLWFDGEWIKEWTEDQGHDLYAFCRSIQGDLIVNNRVGKGRAGMTGLSKSPSAAGDFGTPEQQVPSNGPGGADWESCMTMNDTWGFKTSDSNWKSSQQLIRTLIDIASKGGNYLLNVGPTAQGEIPQPSIERLHDMGQWLKTNGEAIYGTTASPFSRYSFDGRCTVKGNRLFVHVFNWPAEGIRIVGLKTPVRSAEFLGSDQPVRIDMSASGLTIQPPAHIDPVATVVALDLAAAPVIDEQSH